MALSPNVAVLKSPVLMPIVLAATGLSRIAMIARPERLRSSAQEIAIKVIRTPQVT